MRVANSRDPQLAQSIQSWLRNSNRALASVRVVNLEEMKRSYTNKRTADHTPHSPSLRELRDSGARLHVRACDALTTRKFHENIQMGHFTPPHVTKVLPFLLESLSLPPLSPLPLSSPLLSSYFFFPSLLKKNEK
jgi:hypothetical protein